MYCDYYHCVIIVVDNDDNDDIYYADDVVFYCDNDGDDDDDDVALSLFRLYFTQAQNCRRSFLPANKQTNYSLYFFKR